MRFRKFLKPYKTRGSSFREHTVDAGGVAAAILSSSEKIYVGVCVDTCSTLGICAERNAIFNMITNGEQEIKKSLQSCQMGNPVFHAVLVGN